MYTAVSPLGHKLPKNQLGSHLGYLKMMMTTILYGPTKTQRGQRTWSCPPHSQDSHLLHHTDHHIGVHRSDGL